MITGTVKFDTERHKNQFLHTLRTNYSVVGETEGLKFSFRIENSELQLAKLKVSRRKRKVKK